MFLEDILDGIEVSGTFNRKTVIKDIIYDSRKASPDSLFVCIKGFQSDGHSYAMDAYNKGVRLFAAQRPISLPGDAEVIYSNNTRRFLACAAANLFGRPAEKLFTVGVTGTKGKTSTCYMLKSIFEAAGKKVGIMGNIGIYYGSTSEYLGINTPESYEIHRHLRGMVDSGCDVMIMEASSQGFMLDRTYGITYDIGIFTNLSPDHIGAAEHNDFDHYLNCKKKLLFQCKAGFVNSDNEYFERIIKGVKCPIKTFSIENTSHFQAVQPVFKSSENKLHTEFTCIEKADGQEIKNRIRLNTPGYFSLYNAAAAISAARHCNISYNDIKNGLESTFIKGRMEIVPIQADYTVIIDYAHNELSVKNLFRTIKLYNPGRIISVFGCGGNRAKQRRYTMGELIGRFSDISVVTADNSRYEKIEDIVCDIMVGISKTDNEHIIIYDRKKAIEYAMDIARQGDVILLIGKGHEFYEEIEGEKRPFCESQIVLDYFSIKKLRDS